MFKYHVDSPSICSIGYDEQSRVLEVTYHEKGTYQYKNVPIITYQRLSVAKNKQLYLERYVDGNYITIEKTSIATL
ncbi:KTSC domain-containing protein [Providencia rettgeri]|nr:KTSC domain-containing protein [Providencia rettgeri]